MPINTDVEQLIPFSGARCEFPGRKRLSLATLHRWRLHGVRGVQLETCLVGGSRYVSREAIARFIAKQNERDAPAPGITPAQRRRQSDAAREALAEIGI